MSRRLAVGIGSRSAVAADDVVAAVEDALAFGGTTAVGLYTLDRRAGEPGLVEAAARLGLPLAGLAPHVLAARGGETTVTSARSLAAAGVPSVAETAALAGAGAGSRLVVRRRTVRGVTVAVAATARHIGEEP